MSWPTARTPRGLARAEINITSHGNAREFMSGTTVIYRFTRSANSVTGFFSKNRASTDALAALENWREMGAGREFNVDDDQEEQIVATLTFDFSDRVTAGVQLVEMCEKHGVERTCIS